MLNKIEMNNIFSFGSPIEFSLTAKRKTSRHRNHVVVVNGVKTLRGAIVYGPNAAGKTNLIKGVELLCAMFTRNDCKLSVGCQFCLDAKVKPGMSWKIEYSFGGYTFEYAIGTDGKSVLSERLSLRDKKGDVELFRRNPAGKVVLGPLIKNENWYAQRYFTPDSFYLRKLEQDNVRGLPAATIGKDVFVAALDGLHSIHVLRTNSTLSPAAFQRLFNGNDYRAFLLKLMQESDVGITDMTWQKVPLSRLPGMLPFSIAGKTSLPITIVGRAESFVVVSIQNGVTTAFEFRFKHGTAVLRAGLESEGTIRLLHLSAFLYSLQQDESTWFVDEMDCHLHPFLVVYLIQKFFALKDSRSQLVITAHDTNLMTQKLWRTDEVWMTQKRIDGSSNVYSLYSFLPRADKNLADGYVKGLYGALPCIGGEMIHA